MADYPTMPLRTDALIGDTMHLTAAEFGGYVRLLVEIWRSGASLPDDDKRIKRVAGMTAREWRASREVLLAFFNNHMWQRHVVWEDHPSQWPDGKWTNVRRLVLDRDGETCAYCGSISGPFDVDHVFPKSRGGTNAADNLVVSCASCNRSKGARTPDEWRAVN